MSKVQELIREMRECNPGLSTRDIERVDKLLDVLELYEAALKTIVENEDYLLAKPHKATDSCYTAEEALFKSEELLK